MEIVFSTCSVGLLKKQEREREILLCVSALYCSDIDTTPWDNREQFIRALRERKQQQSVADQQTNNIGCIVSIG